MAKNTIAYYTKEGFVESGLVGTSDTIIATSGVDGAKITALYIIASGTTSPNLEIKVGTDTIYTGVVSNGTTDILGTLPLPKLVGGTVYLNIAGNMDVIGDLDSATGSVRMVVIGENY